VQIGGADFIGMFIEGKIFSDLPYLEPAAPCNSVSRFALR